MVFLTPWKNLGIHVKDLDINIVAAPARTLYGTRPSLRYLCVLPAVSAAGGGFRRRRGALRAGMCTLLRYPSRTAENTTIIICTTCCAHRYIFQVRLFRILNYCTDHSTRNSGKLGSFPQFFSHRFYEFQLTGKSDGIFQGPRSRISRSKALNGKISVRDSRSRKVYYG